MYICMYIYRACMCMLYDNLLVIICPWGLHYITIIIIIVIYIYIYICIFNNILYNNSNNNNNKNNNILYNNNSHTNNNNNNRLYTICHLGAKWHGGVAI